MPDASAQLLHGVSYKLTFTGRHELQPGDHVAFVPSADGGCSNAADSLECAEGLQHGGSLDASLTVSVLLAGGEDGTAGSIYGLCLAEAPVGGFPGRAPAPSDFTHHGHVMLVVRARS